MPEVFGANVGGSGIPLVIDNTGLLGTVVSSVRYKENITDMGSSTENIYKLRPVTFTLKKDESKSIRFGLIAEEVEKVYPELVSYNKDNEVESVKYHDLPVIILNELQKIKIKQQAEIELLKKRINLLEVQ